MSKKVCEVHAEIVVKLTEEEVIDIMCSAIEGGIGYWCCLDNTSEAFENAPDDEPTAITAAKIMLEGGKIVLIDEEEDDRPHELDLEGFAQGFRQFIEKGYDQYNAVSGGEVDTGQIDGPAADAIIQLALFDEVLYG